MTIELLVLEKALNTVKVIATLAAILTPLILLLITVRWVEG